MKAGPMNWNPLHEQLRMTLMILFNWFVGLTLLVLGRKLFWLFVGCVGFICGYTSAHQLGVAHSQLSVFLIALLLGLVGALLAVFFQGLAIAVAGFVAGAYVSMVTINYFGFEAGQSFWMIGVIGGVLGAVLLFLIFDWALIFISSLSGASFIVQTLAFKHDLETLLFFILVILGIIIQTALLRKGRRQESQV
jgi:MFS family permease